MPKLKIEDFDNMMDGIMQTYERRRNGGQPGVSPRPKLLQALRMRRGQVPQPGGFEQFTPPQLEQGLGQFGKTNAPRQQIPSFSTPFMGPPTPEQLEVWESEGFSPATQGGQGGRGPAGMIKFGEPFSAQHPAVQWMLKGRQPIQGRRRRK